MCVCVGGETHVAGATRPVGWFWSDSVGCFSIGSAERSDTSQLCSDLRYLQRHTGETPGMMSLFNCREKFTTQNQKMSRTSADQIKEIIGKHCGRLQLLLTLTGA